MQRLKPQEIRCMLLLAEGHSYRQIQEITGFSYTKVNRCLTEGRRSFVQRVEGIEAGAECERLAPLVSALADGVATAKDMAALRPHLRTCLSCRAALRDAREVPARVAALAPIGLLAAGGHGGGLRALTGWINERVTTWVLRGQDLLETASSHKLAAAAASAAALGGGGIATVEVSRHHDAPAHHRRHVHRPPVLRAPVTRRWRPPAAISVRRAPHRHHQKPRPAPTSQAAAPVVVAPTAPAPPPQPAAVPTAEPQTGEFGP
jgi:hypothetical protein